MGTSYRYKCRKCNYDKTFYVGGGFFTDQYYEETEKAEKQLEEDILSGKYGEDIKRIIRVNINQFRYNCNTKLYQCSKCREFTVIREKMIKYGNF